MSKVSQFALDFLRSEDGPTAVEYAVMLALIIVVCIAVIDGWKLKVPNWLTLPLIVSGWALGLLHNCGLLAGTGEGGLGAALAGTALGFVLLLPVYAIGGMGAGDVKMQMGFGSWVGAFFGMSPGLWTIFMAFCIAVILGGFIALGMIMIRGQYRTNLANTREIVGDLFTSSGVRDVA